MIRGPAFQLPICHTGGWGGCGLIQMRMFLIAPGCCLATTLQQPVCTFGMVEGAIEGLKTHPYQPLWDALAILRAKASWQGKSCSWPFNHGRQSLLCTGEQRGIFEMCHLLYCLSFLLTCPVTCSPCTGHVYLCLIRRMHQGVQIISTCLTLN